MPFAHRLVLNQFFLSLFGAKSFQEFRQALSKKELEGLDQNNFHYFYHALLGQFPNLLAPLDKEKLRQYDENIVSHTQQLNEHRVAHGEEPISWKYFQYLILLFTEIYLDWYFQDGEALRAALNRHIAVFNEDKPAQDRIDALDENFEPWSQLNKISFWSATGSGKTLLMHINIAQYQFHLSKCAPEVKSRHRLNRIILLTPNEGLSLQHLEEFRRSGIRAELFQKDSGGLFTSQMVEILDINKLGDEAGDKTVAIEAFEGNNLVLVDEGHRGASGGKEGTWMRFRNALCEKGFSFEYSATFGQAVKKDSKLTDLYAKNILFDYSYRYFYADGFGKDYQILNLETDADEHRDPYLIACLLAFLQQLLLFERNGKAYQTFNIEKPLWIFVGSKVTAKTSKEEASDIVKILGFVKRYIGNPRTSMTTIDQVLNNGLSASDGRNIFAGRFAALLSSGLSPADIFQKSLDLIFNAPNGGLLHIENLKGAEGELALRLGNNPPFGVINVGDASDLLKICTGYEFATGESDFSGSLFQSINRARSPINLLIGSKKFTEGWNSWRVSTMGLMNIGSSEGSQIIQLFGRGVRLKGHDLSLKRSSAIENFSVKPPEHLRLMETLNIFGIRADYMAQFRDFLEEEGVPTNEHQTEFLLPVIKNLGTKKLKTIRLKKYIDGISTEFGDAFRKLGPIPTINLPPNALKKNPLVLNWYPKIQTLQSRGAGGFESEMELNKTHLQEKHIAFLDLPKIYFDLQRFKAERGWYNLNIPYDIIKALLSDKSWYELLIPSAELEFRDSFGRVTLWQAIALSLLKKYVERYYSYAKQEWELPHLEYQDLTEDDPNFPQYGSDGDDSYYRIVIKESEEEIAAKLLELKNMIEHGQLRPWEFHGIKAIWFGHHLYEPLLHLSGSQIEISPAPLNGGERRFIEDLCAFMETKDPLLDKTELYVLRNQSRGKGVGFFEAGNFYPDFILWVLEEGKQYISFVDPKGIRNLYFDDPKILFYKTIKEIEDRLADTSIILNSFIISNTSSSEIGRLWNRTKQEMEKHHILFQEEDRNIYIEMMLSKMMEKSQRLERAGSK